MPVVVVVQGKFANVTKFLQLLRQQAIVGANGKLKVTGRLMIANQIALASADADGIMATLNLDAFVYGVAPPPAAPVGATGATGATSGASS